MCQISSKSEGVYSCKFSKKLVDLNSDSVLLSGNSGASDNWCDSV